MTSLREIFPNDEQYQAFKQTEVERVYLSFSRAGENSLTTSKAGGFGYLPKTEAYPRNEQGKPLSLLAQLNFSELPHIAPYPTKGLLAFYVDMYDDLIGLDFDEPTNQNGFRVFYFENTAEEAYTKEEIQAFFADYADEELYGVVDEELKITGELETQLLTTDSYNFVQTYGTNFYDYLEKHVEEDKVDDVADALFDLSSTGGSALGGYPFFTQEDPRQYAGETTHTELLFQLDTNDKGIMWGDSGIGNFFISKEDLENKNFSNVWYNWDCY